MLVISGTNRPFSYTRLLAERCVETLNLLAANSGSSKSQVLDLCHLKPEIFSPDMYTDKPDWFLREFQEPILKAEGLVVVTPEYNGSFPGVLKYFIDMLKFPESLKGVPTVFIGLAAGQFGAMRAVEHLVDIFSYRGSLVFGERLYIPKIHELVALQSEGLGENQAAFETLLSNFADFVAKFAKIQK